jgi:hemolysin activation/secretion protein
VLDLAFGLRLGTSRTFPVRGYAASDARGQRAVTATAELRWPLVLLGRSLGHLPLGADQISIALFTDAGDAWNGGDGPHPSRLVGVGAEIVADLRANYDMPVRARFGVAYPAGSLDTGRARAATAYAAFGADF